MPWRWRTDVGGGTSYSMLATLGETYKVQMLTGYKPTALELFRMATRGNAERLHLDHEIGALEAGKFADIVVLDPRATPILAARQELSQSLEDMLVCARHSWVMTALFVLPMWQERKFMTDYPRDLKGYGRAIPDPKWPGGAHVCRAVRAEL